MRLLSAAFGQTRSSGPINDIQVPLRFGGFPERPFDPLCLIGKNGSGKSQFLQALAEALQVVWHKCSPDEERVSYEGGPNFEIIYELHNKDVKSAPITVRLSRRTEGGKKSVSVELKTELGWIEQVLSNLETRDLLPQRVIAYTSGDNETLSVPFFDSSLAYGDQVQRSAFSKEAQELPQPRLMLIDYGTHLEMLVANLLMGGPEQRAYLLQDVQLSDLRSMKCVVQLAHGAAPKRPANIPEGRKGVQLTLELERYIDSLKASATAWHVDPQTETYTFDFWINEESRKAFGTWFSSPFDCYQAFHKLSLLNTLIISNPARERFRKAVNRSRFAARLPEPPDEDKVFRFEQVTFTSVTSGSSDAVDYVSLSDGEHQQVQLLGTFTMIADPNVLFLLDEPESHFNPQWRVKFLARIMDIPVKGGSRRAGGPAAFQDVLLTTHAPFVPSDMSFENVLIFSRTAEGVLQVSRPNIQTFGASYEEILASCFDVSPPISQLSRELVGALMASSDLEIIETGIETLGPSIEKAVLLDHLRQVKGETPDVLPDAG
jgi:restriction system-associated AAA family ATPase